MPTNVSTPIWACDLCHTTHGERLDLAQRCESVPLPPLLPDGTPVLTVRDRQFVLEALKATGHIETDVSAYHPEPGHHRRYRQVQEGREQSWTLTDRDLDPVLPGHLQVNTGNNRLHVDGAAGERLDQVSLARALGLGQPGSPLPRGESPHLLGWNEKARWVGPITPAVRAAYDFLGVRLRTTGYRHSSAVDAERSNYLLGVLDGDLARTSMVLALTDPAAIDAVSTDLQRRWFAGEAISAPMPYLDSSSTMTPSKMTKAAKAVVEATGVPWPARTSADEYARHLTRSILMTDSSSFTRGFGTARLVAVGGVKGGVGKTTVAAALARALADSGQRVVLVDLDLDGPNLHLAFDLPPRVGVTEDLTQITATEVAPNLRVFSHGQISHGGLPERWSQAATTDWVRFLGSTLDVSDTDVVVFDLPAGQGAIAGEVLGHNAFARADVLVSVTTPDTYAMADTRRGLRLLMHERREQIVVENLGRVVGQDASGSQVEVRPFGPVGLVETMATKAGATYGGSMPYAYLHETLSDSEEMRALAALVRGGVTAQRG